MLKSGLKQIKIKLRNFLTWKYKRQSLIFLKAYYCVTRIANLWIVRLSRNNIGLCCINVLNLV